MTVDHDVVVIGAGFSGLYAVHKFRDQLGLSVQGFEAAGGVGGTWWFNRYPGARCDTESVHYSYSFSDELQREWRWTEKYAGQQEILDYLEWAADKLDVRRSFRLDTRVTSLTWDEVSAHWTVATSDGAECTARFVISAVGAMSVPKRPEFTGIDSFAGELYWTSSWPDRQVDFAGKRVAVVGTGSTGIQVIQEIAPNTRHLTVFQRTPNYAVPLGNGPVDAEQQRWNAENWKELRGDSRERVGDLPYDRPAPSALAVDPEERTRVYDREWQHGGFRFLTSTFGDLMVNETANETAASYIRDRIRERVHDPVTAELLCPDDHLYGTKRPTFETSYYEAFSLAHVDLVDVRSAPIEAITPTGIRTTQASYDFDAIILATGFDAFTGPALTFPTTGRDGVSLRDTWADGPANYLGLQVAGYPNLFTISGPLSVVSQTNSPLIIEDQIDFAADAVQTTLSRGARTVEATPEAEKAWTRLVNDVYRMSLFAKTEKSWYTGGNIEGKPKGAYVFFAGSPLYRQIMVQAAESGFAGLSFDGAASSLPPLARLDAGAALVVAGMLNSGAATMEEAPVEELRAMNEAGAHMQVPGPVMRVEDVSDARVRVYLPSAEGPLPAVVFCHGGGFISGSLDSVDPTCRRLAAENGVVVVSVDYRLAPEHPFPAATQDTFAALRWTHEHIAEYGGDPARIAVMGESAGGNLAALAAIRARDEGIPLAAQVLIYPTTDPESPGASHAEFAHGPFLTAATHDRFWGLYLGGAEVTEANAPLRAKSLAGTAPALVITSEIDLIRDEGQQYAQALAAADVPVEYQCFDGLIHGSFTMSALIPSVKGMYDLIQEYLASKLQRA
ncbi:flavin-containing monooxygenase [Streptomyces spongiae]|uniref:Alpha/beta fold hydrolase n=1 Tax=Streptomyces spongiae TaxID=565072 RepID=A0A5N8XMN7_9ACTN|nr:alpha/beta fold hydrolase [Streptomyces spongiae]MPY60701.1 alpha/beta fold hydrolase [Streptomyces spongiae]